MRGAFGFKPATATIISIIVCLVIMMLIPANFYATVSSMGASTISSIKTGGKGLFSTQPGSPFCYLKYDPQVCAAGPAPVEVSKIEMSFPTTIYTAGKALDISSKLVVLNKEEASLKIKPQCYLGTKNDANKIATTIGKQQQEYIFKKSSSEQTAMIKCYDSAATAEKVKAAKNLLVELERTSKATLTTSVAISPPSSEGTKGPIEIKTEPLSSVLPYSVELEIIGSTAQPFSEGQDFQLLIKKQKDFDLKSIDSIAITTPLQVTCTDPGFAKSETAKDTIEIKNIAAKSLKNYLKAADTYGFDCRFDIIIEPTEEQVMPFKIEIIYTTTKDFSASLAVA